MMRKPTETAHRSTWTLKGQLGSLHGTKLGSLYVGDSCVGLLWGLFVGPLAVGPDLIPGAWAGFVKPTPMIWCLVQPWCRREKLCPASLWYALFCWCPWEACPFLNRNGLGVGDNKEEGAGRIGERETVAKIINEKKNLWVNLIEKGRKEPTKRL